MSLASLASFGLPEERPVEEPLTLGERVHLHGIHSGIYLGLATYVGETTRVADKPTATYFLDRDGKVVFGYQCSARIAQGERPAPEMVATIGTSVDLYVMKGQEAVYATLWRPHRGTQVALRIVVLRHKGKDVAFGRYVEQDLGRHGEQYGFIPLIQHLSFFPKHFREG